jgi:hypothetical protein
MSPLLSVEQWRITHLGHIQKDKINHELKG